MDSLSDDIFIKIMRCNSHPCADMMTDLYKPYMEAMQIQIKSPDKHFRNAPQPSFFEWKLHGIGCEQWGDAFEARDKFKRMTCVLDRLGDRRLDRMLTLWENERGRLLDFEYKS